jgi:HEAT repeat protein
MARNTEISSLSWKELLTTWESHQNPNPGYSDDYLDELAIELRARGPKGMAFLKAQLAVRDEERVVAALIALKGPPLTDNSLPQTFLDLLSDRRGIVRAWAIRSLSAYGRAADLPRVVPLLVDPSPYVRCAALEFVRRHDPERSKTILLSALSDEDYLVRMCAADELDELDDPTVVPHLQPLLADPHPHVRQAAETAIENLAATAGAAD